MAQAVNWDPNRYGSVKHVLEFDSNTGTYSLVEQAHDYTGTNYNFAALSAADTTTTTTTAADTTTQTTQEQTTEAFGDVKPHYWQDEGGGGGGANVFQWNEKSAQTEEDMTAKEYKDYANDFHLQAQFPTFEAYQKSLHPFKSGIKSITDPFAKPIKQAWEWAKPLAVKAIDYITKRPAVFGSSATHSHRGIGGLYNKEINLMNTYGSTTATEGNPTGDPRKDDAGFNIVSFAGNYNKIGTWSRLHNMLKKANIYEKGTIEYTNTRIDIRNAWKNEKKTGKVDENHKDTDASGSNPVAPTSLVNPMQQGGKTQTTTPKTTTGTVHSGQPTGGHHPGGGGGIGSTASKQGPAGGSVGASRFK